MEIDRTRDKALQKANASDFKQSWSLLPSTGNGEGERNLMSQADNSASRAWLWPFCLFASYPLLLFPILTFSFLFRQPLRLLLSGPPFNPALFSAQSGEVSS